MTNARALRDRVIAEAGRAIVGQEETIELLLVALLSGGHVLIEGVPGTAKTLMAKTLAMLIGGADFTRVQFTPDLMPSDIVGTNVYDWPAGRFHLRKGPIFTNVLLADEINRAPAKTQSALLEAMEERQVTLDGTALLAADPFITVIATQNPIEYEGTYPLPEAQIDRFFFKVLVDYASQEEENEVLRRYHERLRRPGARRDRAAAGADEPGGIERVRADCQAIQVDDGIVSYITSIVRETRSLARYPARRQPACRHRAAAGEQGAGRAGRSRLRDP